MEARVFTLIGIALLLAAALAFWAMGGTEHASALVAVALGTVGGGALAKGGVWPPRDTPPKEPRGFARPVVILGVLAVALAGLFALAILDGCAGHQHTLERGGVRIIPLDGGEGLEVVTFDERGAQVTRTKIQHAEAVTIGPQLRALLCTTPPDPE